FTFVHLLDIHLTPSSGAFSWIAHHRDLLGHSSIRRFEAYVCTSTSGGLSPITHAAAKLLIFQEQESSASFRVALRIRSAPGIQLVNVHALRLRLFSMDPPTRASRRGRGRK